MYSSFIITKNLPLKEKLSKLLELLLRNGAYLDSMLKIYYDDDGLSVHSIADDFNTKKNIEIPKNLIPKLNEYTFHLNKDILICKANNLQNNSLQN